MDLKKEVFTTFEAANLCNANVSSIKNWIEKGELDAFRTPGGHYRIRNNSLSEFLDKHGMPNPLAETGTKVVAAFQEDQILSILSEELEHIEFFATSHILDTLLLLGEHQPRHVILSERCLLDLDTRDVIAAIMPGRCAAPPAPAIMTLKPAARAPSAKATMRCGVRCAETIRTSQAMSSAPSTAAASDIVSQSDWLPMTIAICAATGVATAPCAPELPVSELPGPVIDLTNPG